jgi:hypothetical protein
MKNLLLRSILSVTLVSVGILGGIPIAQAAAPICALKVPATVTNSLLTVNGTSSDASGTVANVFVMVNNNGNWIAATPSNGLLAHWSAQVELTNGANNIKAYAENSVGQVSPTNSENVKYEPVAQLYVNIIGPGKVTPNYNGQNLVISNRYTITALADPGCKFTNWVVTGPAPTNSTRASLSFTMSNNLILTASFYDDTKPTILVTAPVPAKSSNSVVTVAGTAKDNVGVESVYYAVNFGPTNFAVISTNKFTNWSAVLILNPGTNVVRFYAQDAAGNVSAPGIVILTDESKGFAPQSLGGVVLTADAGSPSPFTVFFGMSTYAVVQSNQFEVHDYVLSQIDSNTAQFMHQNIASGSSDGGTTTLSFTSTTSGTYSNSDETSGTFTAGSAYGAAPSSLEETTLLVNGSSASFSNYLANGAIASTGEPSGSPIESGTYTYVVYAPQMALLTAVFAGTNITSSSGIETNSVLLDFGSDEFDSKTSAGTLDSGAFSWVEPAKAPSGHAPESLAGVTAAVTAKHQNNGGPTEISTPMVSFGQATFGQFDSNTNDNSDVGNYIYSRTGPDTGLLSFYPIAPTDTNNDNHNTGIMLTFTAAGATFTNGNDSGHVTVSRLAETVPVTLAGKTLHFVSTGKTTVATFGYDTFSAIQLGKTNSDTGTYFFGQFGPQAAFLQVNDQTSAKTNYITLWFTTASSGKFVNTDSNGNSKSGTFQ